MEKKVSFKKARVASAIILGLASTGALAFADEAKVDESVERIQVTGSHIKRQDLEGPSPLTSISSEDIAKTGVTDLIGLFAKLPISGQGTFSTQGNSSDDTANGGSSVSIRGLGADSTLILVNGRRVSVSPFAKGIDTAFVDINNIPLSAIKRVDILKDGASATYGSDAIAGVINVVLKDDFDGVEISAKVGGTSDGGGDEQNFSMLWGSGGDGVNHTFIVDYYKRGEIMYSDRDYSKSANQAGLTGRPDAVDFRSSSGFPGTIALRSDPTDRMPDTYGNDVCPADQIVGTLCRYDYAPHMTMVPSTERFSFNYMGSYEITDSVSAFTELNGQNARSTIKGAGSPSFNELFMDGDNVNHPFVNDPTHPYYQEDLTMRRRMVDIGNRKKEADTDYYRSVIGVKGFTNNWDWELAYSYIKNETTEQGVDGFPNMRRVQEAIDSGLWDPFEPSANSPESLAYIETTTNRIGKSTNRSFDGSISGSIMDLEHGELMLGVGFEHRKESISDNPDDQYIRGEIFGTEATQANGERDNTAIFAELGLPLLETVEMQFAIRHEDYSDFGTTTDPKVAFMWTPSEDMTVRGSWGTAFRAPSLHQLGLGRTDESPNLVDTVRCDAVGNVNKACEPQEYTAVFEGNPELGPEESESYNVGVIYEFENDLSLSVDYYNYAIENIIDSDTQFVFTNFGGDPAVVERLPTANPNDPGEVVTIFDSFQNIGDLNTSGLDIDVQYALETDMGAFNFNYVLNYVLEFEDLRPGANGGQRVNAVEGDFEQPEIRWTFNSSWAVEDMNASLAVNYIGEFAGSADAGFGDKTVDAMTTVDVTFSYLVDDNTTLTLGVTNLFNEEPPFSHHDFMGFVNSTHSGQGRFGYAKVVFKL